MFELADNLAREFLNTASFARNNRHNRGSQFRRQRFRIHHVPVLFGHIQHVQSDDGGIAKLDDLRGKVEITLQVCRINNQHDDAWRRKLPDPAEEDVPGNLLIWRVRHQAVCSRQVDHRYWIIRNTSQEPAFLSLHGNPAIVADFLAQAVRALNSVVLPQLDCRPGPRTAGSGVLRRRGRSFGAITGHEGAVPDRLGGVHAFVWSRLSGHPRCIIRRCGVEPNLTARANLRREGAGGGRESAWLGCGIRIASPLAN